MGSMDQNLAFKKPRENEAFSNFNTFKVVKVWGEVGRGIRGHKFT
jgi:hypothetical protein